MRIGILFGGNSREREISFAGGRTVYDNLDKDLFTPVPIFVDSFGQFILLNWSLLYKGSIRDFYPAASCIPSSWLGVAAYAESLSPEEQKQPELIAEMGKLLTPEELSQHIDFAFLCLHGRNGEDGAIQGLLQYYQIPFSGSGIFSSALGMNKRIQKDWMVDTGIAHTEYMVITRDSWMAHGLTQSLLQAAKAKVKYPLVIRPANQGSSIGISIIHQEDEEQLAAAIDKAFFIKKIGRGQWKGMSYEGQLDFIQDYIDFRNEPGLPAIADQYLLVSPQDLYDHLNYSFDVLLKESVTLAALDNETEVLIEGFIEGKEFSTIVIRDEDNEVIALPPTEIKKGKEVYDYRSKYLAGLSSKITPIDLPEEQIHQIRKKAEALFVSFNFQVYARIDGFIKKDGTILLNDPNTTSGMLPSSFFFHQAAEIGLAPSQFISFIIRNSIKARLTETNGNSYKLTQLLMNIDKLLVTKSTLTNNKPNIGVILGGYSSERHISVESGRNIYEKLNSSGKYNPKALFLTGNDAAYELYELPINILLKDNADDIKHKIDVHETLPLLENIKKQAEKITAKYVGKHARFEPKKIALDELASSIDFAFIALHGRPGEDGNLQRALEARNIPYNGSGPDTSSITIDKYRTNQLLKENGILVADQLFVSKAEWLASKAEIIAQIENNLGYPFILKPHDDGCSSAVKLIKNSTQLESYVSLMFELDNAIEHHRSILGLKEKEEFPTKNFFLAEQYISKGDAHHFLEVTGGLLTHYNELGYDYEIEILNPSESLAINEVLSLEEKFLAGEGQNITPARFSKDKIANEQINESVKSTLKRVAKILGIEGYARIDAFVKIYKDGTIKTYIIEINSLPGMTPATCIFHQAAINGYTPFQFIDQIITYGVKKIAQPA